MLKYVPRVGDFCLLFAASALFGAVLTARLQTGSYGILIPDAPYIYERSDFFIDALVAALAGWSLLLLLERLTVQRYPRFARYGCFAMALLLVMYWGPPSPIIFGNTWGPGEVSRELFLAQMDIVMPLGVTALILRASLRKIFVMLMPGISSQAGIR